MSQINNPKWLTDLIRRADKPKARPRPATPKERVLDQFRSTTTSTLQSSPVKSVNEVLREILK